MLPYRENVVEPDLDAGDVEMSQIVLRGLLEASGEATKALQVVKEDLDQIARSIGAPIEPRLLAPTGMWMNDRLQPRLLGARADGVGVVAGIRDEFVPAPVLTDDRLGDGGLVLLSWRDLDVERAAFRVGESVNLRGESTSRTPQCIAPDPPFPPAASWWARTTEASMMTPSSATSS